ncbi:MAG: hypothetical protein ACLT5H_06225 [Collinsella stercoris]|uniref:hypothetical protein n=1 Tax=Collinsella stercoris TaxID=147206 RepID=UPI003995605C
MRGPSGLAGERRVVAAGVGPGRAGGQQARIDIARCGERVDRGGRDGLDADCGAMAASQLRRCSGSAPGASMAASSRS